MASLAYMWARAAEVSLAQVQGDNTGFYQTKLATARFYMRRLLPQTKALSDALMSGSDTLMVVDAGAF